ncbi:MAG: hypothetical protein J6Z36_04450 [Clostridia bacterium]|nr:hypothetical protein [Clostridia bacterium]
MGYFEESAALLASREGRYALSKPVTGGESKTKGSIQWDYSEIYLRH